MNDPRDDDLRPEYSAADLDQGVRGKYYERYQQGNNLILLDPDVAKAFPDARKVNEALRMLMQVAKTAANSV